MLLLEFDRGLLKFSAKTPLLAPLFQLPPRIAHRASMYSPLPMPFVYLPLASIAFLYPPMILPISVLWRLQ
ncbi:MAG: hypothetical protein NC489_33900, partial [Ruminococcus flavefaciens]|nr:hypothetical protein [Ruminococcus flavefaciens]